MLAEPGVAAVQGNAGGGHALRLANHRVDPHPAAPCVAHRWSTPGTPILGGMATEPTQRRCKGETAKGDPCRAHPLRPGTVIEGVAASGEYCRGHDPELPQRTQLTAEDRAKGGAATRKVKPMEIERRVMENYAIAWMRPYWRILGFDVRLDDDGELCLTELPEGGAKLHGESRDGVVRVSGHDDLAAQMAAAEKLRDRVFGRPTSRAEVAGTVEHRNADKLNKAIEAEIEQLTARLQARERERLTERLAAGVGHDEAERLLGEAIKRPEPAPEPDPDPEPEPAEPAEPEPQTDAEPAATDATAEPEPEPRKPNEGQHPGPKWERKARRELAGW